MATFKLTYTPPAEMRTTIPFARIASGQGELLVDAAGSPVWPIGSDEDLRAVSSTAEVFSAALTEVPASHAPAQNSGPEVVVGVGDVTGPALLYGHLTGRRVETVPSFADLRADELPAVIIYRGEKLDPQLVQLVTLADYGKVATGIVWGRTEAELRSQILSASCAATANGPLDQGHLDLVGPNLGVASQGRSVGALRDLLSSGMGVISVLAHSEGTSQAIDSTAVLCPRATAVDASPDRGPECIYTGNCHHLGKEFDTVLGEGRIIGPSEVAARLFVNMGCHSAFIGNAAVDSAWSTLPGLVANPRVGAVLATPTLGTYLGQAIQAELLRPLMEGLQVGRALARFEENPRVKEFNYRMILFGDPRVRAKPAAGSMMGRRIEEAPTQRVPSTGALISTASPSELELRMEFVRRIGLYFRPDTREAGQETSQILKEKADELDAATLTGAEAADGDPGNELRAAILNHLDTTKARLWEAWQRGPYRCRPSEDVKQCPQCGWQARSQIVELSGGLVRERLLCARCSDVWDFDVLSTRRPVIEFPEVRIEPDNDVSSWAGRVFFVRARATDTKSVAWPAADDGRPARRFSIDRTNVAGGGLVRVYAVFIDELSINSCCAPVGPMS